MNTYIYKVTRVLEYTGAESWLDSTFKNNAVQGSRQMPNGASIVETISARELVRTPTPDEYYSEVAHHALRLSPEFREQLIRDLKGGTE